MGQEQPYDVVIIGSGIAGSMLAAILARHGRRVLMVEAKSHPRFAIGESMILESSELMRALAQYYEIPELAFFSSENYLACAGPTHGIKRHFGFLLHDADGRTPPEHALQAVIPRQPHGHELHLYRQDSDYFMLACAIKYGATVRQNTRVEEIEIGPDGVELVTAEGETIRAAYLVDGAGAGSPLSRKFALREQDLATHSRALFTHMVGVVPHRSDRAARRAYDLPYPMHEGTLHHLFDGGWLWVIPFDNHRAATNPLTSIGLMLDPRRYPLDESLTPEEEFRAHVARFPTIARQLAGATAVRPWVRTPRIQYRARQVVGDRWALLSHAAGFVDPLYSKGLYNSMVSVALLADQLLAAGASGDYSAAAFAPLEQVTQRYLAANDRLVANSYRAFASPPLWRLYSTLWLLGAYTEYVMLNSIRARAGDDRADYMARLTRLGLVGGGFEGFDRLAGEIDRLVEEVDTTDEAAVATVVATGSARLRETEWVPRAFIDLLDGKRYLPRQKLRPSLLARGGFMGNGAYRRHFFGEHSTAEMLRVFLTEKVRYATPVVSRQRVGLTRPE